MIGEKDCRHGRMIYLKNDWAVGEALDRYGEYSESEAEGFVHLVQPGQTAVDVGANIGALTVPLAKQVGPTGSVIAIEPQRRIYYILCGNIALNELYNVRALQVGMGSESGQMIVPSLDYQARGNFGGIALEKDGSGETVEIVTLDSLRLKPDFLKIDVEHMESEVIAGGTETIIRHKPIIQVENIIRSKSKALMQQIIDLGYELYWNAAPLFSEDNHFGCKENIYGVEHQHDLLVARTSTHWIFQSDSPGESAR